jgi:hypothetical protein
MLLATVNEPVTLSMLAGDGNASLFGQARLYSQVGVLAATVNLNHVAEGLYQGTYTSAIEGQFNIVYQFYSNTGRTVDAGYDLNGEFLDVNSFRTNILKVLGLLHDNSVVDSQTYDVDGNLTSARIRSYNNATNAQGAVAASPAAFVSGLLFTWNVAAEYTSGALSKYSLIRAP